MAVVFQNRFHCNSKSNVKGDSHFYAWWIYSGPCISWPLVQTQNFSLKMEGYLCWKYKMASLIASLKWRELLNGGVLNRRDRCIFIPIPLTHQPNGATGMQSARPRVWLLPSGNSCLVVSPWHGLVVLSQTQHFHLLQKQTTCMIAVQEWQCRKINFMLDACSNLSII